MQNTGDDGPRGEPPNQGSGGQRSPVTVNLAFATGGRIHGDEVAERLREFGARPRTESALHPKDSPPRAGGPIPIFRPEPRRYTEAEMLGRCEQAAATAGLFHRLRERRRVRDAKLMGFAIGITTGVLFAHLVRWIAGS